MANETPRGFNWIVRTQIQILYAPVALKLEA